MRSPGSSPTAANRLKKYHTQAVAAIDKSLVTPGQQAVAKMGGGFKGGSLVPNGNGAGGFQAGFGGIQGPMIGGLQGGGPYTGIEGPTSAIVAGSAAFGPVAPGTPLAKHPGLVLDTGVNETIRRRQVHTFLVNSNPVKPNDIKSWLFKEVLHADLDDPMLGLGPLLSQNYPFASEDRVIAAKK
ncbi:hypothetical protein [Fimbriiglobus ruber]|nr:hypothetical protein [Fimbriiglobus ruber]